MTSSPSHHSPSAASRIGKTTIAALLLVLLVQLLVRFAVPPAVGFVLDDWSYREEVLHYDSLSDAVVAGILHPHRPFLHAIQLGINWVLRDNLSAFLLLSATGYSLALFLLFLLLRELTDRPVAAIAGTLVFALLPNQCDQFHWLCIAIPYGLFCQPLCLLSAWCLVRYARRGGTALLAVSAIAYFFACGIYEVGVFLPMAYAVLLLGRSWKRWFADLTPYGIAFALYASWRLTNGFGWGHSWFGIPPQTGIALDLYNLKMTVAGIVSWWGGQNWWRAVGFGGIGFGELPWTRAAVFFVADLALLGGLAFALRRLGRRETRHVPPAPFPTGRLLFFGATWFAATLIPALLAYFVTRINYLPGVGVVLLLTGRASRIRPSRWLPVLLPLALAGMVVAQGDSLNWASTIRFQNNLARTLVNTQSAWQDAELVWLDTRSLAHRLSPGLGPVDFHVDTIAFYRFSGLLRGFGPTAMMDHATGHGNHPPVILDVEYGAHQEGDTLYWHERYNPDAPHKTPMERVCRIDAFEAGKSKTAP